MSRKFIHHILPLSQSSWQQGEICNFSLITAYYIIWKVSEFILYYESSREPRKPMLPAYPCIRTTVERQLEYVLIWPSVFLKGLTEFSSWPMLKEMNFPSISDLPSRVSD